MKNTFFNKISLMQLPKYYYGIYDGIVDEK